MTIETIIWLIPLPPLLAFFLIVLFTNRSKWLSHTLAVGAALLSWLGSMVVFFRALRVEHLGGKPFISSFAWLPAGDTWFKIGVQIDPLSAATLFFVAWTVLMIFIYSVGYHNYGQPKGDHDVPGLQPHGATITDAHGHQQTVPSVEPMYSRFFAFIGLFAFGMYTLVVSDNLLTLFIGWEIMGLCSYLLIGFWYGKPSARAAMIKAFITTRVGDVFMLLGIAYLYSAAGTLNYREIFYNPDMLKRLAEMPSYIAGLSTAGLIGILLFIGTIGKSAQWPLHVWLPDAMEGPTPVSAMIHAAAMVSAGVYMAIRIFPLLTADWTGHALTPAMTIMAFIGAFTALFAATIAVTQNDIKRVLAYSTISQLGYMVAALGIGAYVAAAFHLLTHAFFKALLFLGSGSVIHGVEHGVLHTGEHTDPQNMFNMGGLRKKMPLTFWTFLIGGFALSGFPIFTAGFWSKDEILADAFLHQHFAVFITLAVAALLTAFYTMRQITLTFLGEPRTESAHHAKETPWTMTLPLVVLAVLAISSGWVGIPEGFPILSLFIPNFFHEFVGGTLVELPSPVFFQFIPMLTSVVAALGGLTLGWFVYREVRAGQPDPVQKFLGDISLGWLYNTLKNKYYFDEIYDFLFVRPAYWVSETFTSAWMDRGVIDGFLHWVAMIMGVIGNGFRNYIDKPIVNGFGDFVGESIKKFGRTFRVVQSGRVQQYMIGALVTLAFFSVLFYYLVFTPRRSLRRILQERTMDFLASHLITFILFTPALAAAVVFFLPREQENLIRWAAFVLSFVPLAFSLALWFGFDAGRAGFQFEEKAIWYTAINSSYHLGVDGISLTMVLLTTLLTPLAILASFSIQENIKAYMILFFLLEMGMLGVFVVLDLLLFFVFWEFGLVPMYFLINQWGSEKGEREIWGGRKVPARTYASFKFMIYTMAGSLGLLLAIQLIGSTARTYDMTQLFQIWPGLQSLGDVPLGLPVSTVKAVAFWAFAIAFAIKVPVWPFHTWLPDAHTEAPTAGSMILAGVLLKLGAYGFLRLVLPLYPQEAKAYAGALGFLAVMAIIFGAFASYGQDDFKRLVAYSSVNHMGFVVLGVAAAAFARGTPDATLALNGAVLQMFNHGLSAAGMFFLVGVIYERTHTRNLKDFGGLFPLVPVYGGILIFTAMGSLGLPGLGGFISEFLVVRGTWPIFTVYTALAMIGLLFTGAYILKGIKMVLHGPLNEHWVGHLTEINAREILVIAPLMVLMLWIGVWPAWILNVINKAVVMLF